MRIALAVVALLHLHALPAFAHGGGTDPQGCHVDSSTGSRHCHGGGSSSPPPSGGSGSSGSGSGDGVLAVFLILASVVIGGLACWGYSTQTRLAVAPVLDEDGARVVVLGEF